MTEKRRVVFRVSGEALSRALERVLDIPPGGTVKGLTFRASENSGKGAAYIYWDHESFDLVENDYPRRDCGEREP